MSKNLSIEKIDILNIEEISEIEKNVELKIVTEHRDVEFAWYIYRDKKRIEMKWYNKENQTIKINLFGEGEYYLRGFIRNGKGNKVAENSDMIIIQAKKVELSSLERKALKYEAFKEEDFKVESPTIYKTQLNGLTYDFLLKTDVDSPYLTILGPAANSLKPPVFVRYSWMNLIKGNVLYYNDPTLYLTTMRTGYGLGNSKVHALKQISQFIQIIANNLGVNNKNILFFGSSAGGFMALMLGGYVKNSSVLINNPVTVASYSPYFNSLERILRTKTNEFKGFKKGEIKEKYNKRVDVREFYRTLNHLPNIYYLQNASCKNDMDNRLNPFISFYEQLAKNNLDNQLIIDLYWDEEAQHNPVSKEKTLRYIEKVRKMWLED